MRKITSIVVLLTIIALVVTACGGGAAPTTAPADQPTTAPADQPTTAPADQPTAAPADQPTTAPADQPTAAPAGTGSFLDRAMAGEFTGKVVSMMGPFTADDEVKFNNSVKDFEDKTGIDIQYEGTKTFETTISVRADAGNPPDIADFPQPGLLGNLAKSGKIVDVSTFMDTNWLKQNYLQSWLDMAMMPGADGNQMMAGIWARFNGKSLVWYPKKAFDAAGYKIPQTWDEMMALTKQIADDGDTAWCIGIQSGDATGWPATDWIEDIMLRTTSLENYDKWTKGQLKFESPEVKAAAEKMAEIWLNDKYVFGGRNAIVSTSFGDAPTPMFQNPPKCWLHRQGNFIISFFPAGAVAGTDYDFFYLPPIDPQYGKPFLVAGDIYAMFKQNDRPEVRAAMEYFTHGESLKSWMAAGGALAPQNDADLAWYGSDVERGIAKLVRDSTAVRFDGSDLMPGEVGAGSFWKGMTSWIAGTIDLDTALKEIDAAWPKS